MERISLETILRLETKVWEALRTGDAELDARMLSENFLGLYPTGFANREDHCAPLKAGPTVADFEIVTPRLIELTPEIVLLAYLAKWRRIKHGEIQAFETMYISSIWQLLDNDWKNIFSQDTPAED